MLKTKEIRKDFPILERKIKGKPLVYLDNAATTQKPRQVIKAITDYYEKHNANVARGVHSLAEEATELYETARRRVAKQIGAKAEEVVFVRNSTEGLNLAAFSWALNRLKKGDTLITSVLEHHSNFLPWRMVAEKTGAKLKLVDIDEEGRLLIGSRQKGSKLLYPLEEVLDEKVKLVALSAKSNVTGAIQPIAEVIKLKEKLCPEAVVVLDGSQSVPHMAIDVQELGVDFLVFSGHKMLGPMGVGVLWGRRKLWEKMEPFLRGGDMISAVDIKGQTWNRIPYKFEAGTPNVAGAVGLGRAVEYLDELGMEKIFEHEKELTAYTMRRFEELKQKTDLIEIYGPREARERAGVFTFNIKGVHAHDTAQVLDSQGVEVRSGQHCAGPLAERLEIKASVRASFYVYNTLEEVEALVQAVLKAIKVFKV